jgi:amino acid transporter
MKNALLVSVNIGLLLSYLFTYYCHDQINIYKNELPEQLLSKYENIKNERMNHLIIGILIALFICFVFYFKSSHEFSRFQKINIMILILLLLPIVVYKILPKSDYMLKHSHPEKDYKEWFDIYSCMKNKSIYGFFCGFSVSIIILSLFDIN